jgi:hypothetical protein
MTLVKTYKVMTEVFSITEVDSSVWGPTYLYFSTNMGISYTNPLKGVTAAIRKGTRYRLTLYTNWDEEILPGEYVIGNLHKIDPKTGGPCDEYECLQYVGKDEYGKITKRVNIRVEGEELAVSTALSTLLMQATNGDNYEGNHFSSPVAVALFYKKLGVRIKEKVHAADS